MSKVRFLVLLALLNSFPVVGAPCPALGPGDGGKVFVAGPDRDDLKSVLGPRVEMVRFGAPADLNWDRSAGRVVGATGLILAEGIVDECAFAAVVAKWLSVQELENLARARSLRVFTLPAGDGVFYEGEKAELLVAPDEEVDAHITLVDLQSDGSLSYLFPLMGDDPGPVLRGRMLRLGGADAPVVRPPFGTDHIIAISTRGPAKDMQAALRYVGERDALGRARERVVGGHLPVSYAAVNAVSILKGALEREGTRIGVVQVSTLPRGMRPILKQRASLEPWPYRRMPRPLFLNANFKSVQTRPLAEPLLRLAVAPGGELDFAQIAGKKLALVVGNADYKFQTSLKNPRGDATAFAETLKRQGFELIGGKAQFDVGIAGLQALVRTTAERARTADGVVVFYAGHGVESRGINYLVPVDAKLAAENDLTNQALPLLNVMSAIDPAKMSVVIVDACRVSNFPLAGPDGKPRGLRVKGLAPQMTPGSLMYFSALPGQVASDGAGVHSPFAISLLKHMVRRGLTVRKVFNAVTGDFQNAARTGQIDAETQFPILYDLAGTEEFYFHK